MGVRNENPHSLGAYENMRRLGLAKLIGNIDDAKCSVKSWADSEARDDIVTPEGLDLYVQGNLFMVHHFAENLELQSTWNRVWHGGGAFYLISSHLTWQQLFNELTVLRQAIEADLEKHLFVQIVERKAEKVEHLKGEWEAIWTAIPDAREDIEEAVYCYALDRNTASVFHLMRVVEWGLRSFCWHLGFKQTKAFIKAKGVFKFTPIEFETWERILGQLRPHAQEKIDKLKNRDRKQKLQEFYFSTLAEVEGFKDAWRNHVMHVRRSYSSEDSLAVMAHVRRFMNLLVSNGVMRA
jgi:hypothetical protein